MLLEPLLEGDFEFESKITGGAIPKEYIPGRKNRIKLIEYDKDKFKLRSKIENFFAKLKENRRLALQSGVSAFHGESPAISVSPGPTPMMSAGQGHADCCSVDVINGAGGFFLILLFFTSLILKF